MLDLAMQGDLRDSRRISLRIVDAAGNNIAQNDQVVAESVTAGLFVPPATAPGAYRLAAVLYDLPDMAPLTDGDKSPEIELMEIEVLPPPVDARRHTRPAQSIRNVPNSAASSSCLSPSDIGSLVPLASYSPIRMLYSSGGRSGGNSIVYSSCNTMPGVQRLTGAKPDWGSRSCCATSLPDASTTCTKTVYRLGVACRLSQARLKRSGSPAESVLGNV